MICHFRTSLTAICMVSWIWLQVWAWDLSDTEVSVIEARLADGAKQSWELGTRSQALLELHVNIFSVLSHQPLPPRSTIPANLSDQMSTILGIAKSVVSNRTSIQGPQPLMQDGSAGDPASIGMVVLLANWTGQATTDNLDYAGAATDQLDYLLENVPRSSDGAISHRTEQVQLWSDFVYMVPPFLAYYGVLSANQTLVSESYHQILLYRKHLFDESTSLWRHVSGTSSTDIQNDMGHWATGNGWAAAGMLRVLGTIQNSQYAKSMKNEQTDLANWVKEIQSGMYKVLDSSCLFKNYPDEDLSYTNFYDASSTALMASTVYRLALIRQSYTHLPVAEKSRLTLSSASSSSSKLRARAAIPQFLPSATDSSVFTPIKISSAPSPSHTAPSLYTRDPSSALEHFTADGWLTPVVNPYSYSSQGTQSPEGQAFVLEMQAAWRDWVAAGSPGANGCMSGPHVNWMSGLTIIVGVVLQWIG